MSIQPPRPRGPSLNALRAFEASARLGGFTAAAEELNVTPGAVAQQIKNLEDWLGEPLFQRTSQGVRLTALGEATAGRFSDAFDQLGEAVGHLRARASTAQISVAALPSLAQCWLMPRLPALRRALPDLVISVTALEKPPNLIREAFDVSLFFSEAAPGADEIRIAEDRIYPVCAPEIAASVSSVDDLTQIPCLRDGHWQADWQVWLRRVMPDRPVAVTGPQYSLYSMALDAARSGGGVLMGHDCLVTPLIERGELVRLFDLTVPTGRWLTLRTTRPVHPALKRFVDLLAS
ncbi:LysR family transcriptional regulator [Pacificispira sp.]|uniref:LysR family transcriptional regulator n=1 Tax=Pacificispira sp. TaxID=2888761 RepID=UPI003BA88D66